MSEPASPVMYEPDDDGIVDELHEMDEPDDDGIEAETGAGNQDMNIEAVRADVRFALSCQPGEEFAAIDGDAYMIYKISYFTRTVPPAWVDKIQSDLVRKHHADWIRDRNPYDPDSMIITGVSSLEFHYWVTRLVEDVDPTFESGDKYIGRGFTARALLESLSKWAHVGVVSG